MLQEKLSRWATAGLITEDQSKRILAYEAAAAKQEERRVPLIVEALGYLGAALAVIAVLILAQEFWAVTIGLLVAGWVLRNSPLEAIRRLAGFLWFFAVVGAGFSFGILSVDGLDTSDETALLVGSAAAAAIAFLLWRFRTQSLQQVAFAAGLWMALIGLFLVAEWPEEAYGLGLWALGTVWLFLTWGTLIRPVLTGYALGGVASLIGVQLLAVDERGWPLLLGVLVAGLLIVASVTLRQIILLAIGSAGVFIFVPQVVFHFFGDSLGAPVALLISGAALIAGAVALARLMGEIKEDIAEAGAQPEEVGS
jgi:hypothetical protein